LFKTCKPNAFNPAHADVASFCLVDPTHFQPESHVVDDGPVWQQAKSLEHHGRPAGNRPVSAALREVMDHG
jgi:hypothetical protein